MGFADSFKKVIGLSEIDEDEIVTEEELKSERRSREKESRREAKRERREREVERERERDFTPPYKANSTSSASSSSYSKSSAYVGSTGSAGSSTEKRFSLANSGSLKLILIEPKSIDECPKLVDSLKARKPIIINLEKLETDTARKIFDFLSGATYALDGNVQKIASNIFIFTPDNVSVAEQKQAESIAMEADRLSSWR